jgi:excisionase family DNA binding protein
VWLRCADMDGQEDLLGRYPDVLTVEEVAEVLRLTPRTARTLAAKDKIPGAFKVGAEWRFYKRDIIEMIRSGKRPDDG